jgi:hypothetical protein
MVAAVVVLTELVEEETEEETEEEPQQLLLVQVQTVKMQLGMAEAAVQLTE